MKSTINPRIPVQMREVPGKKDICFSNGIIFVAKQHVELFPTKQIILYTRKFQAIKQTFKWLSTLVELLKF